ncbi:MAG: hypothetical protein K0S65_5697, partial [Labilithrix sp.]|nr:hypothetical protein [Labilithrix sp.]
TYLVEQKDGVTTHTPLVGPLPPGQVAAVFLSHDDAARGEDSFRCPPDVTPALLVPSLQQGTVKASAAFHIKADAPVSSYSIAPYGGAPTYIPSATLLLPASSWTKNYVVVEPNLFGEDIMWPLRRTLQVVASEDDTQVSMRPKVRIFPGTNVDGAMPGVLHTWTLARGDVLQISQQETLTGNVLEATKPIGVFGGSDCTAIVGGSACDWLQQQIPPLSHWGTEYAAVPYKARFETIDKVDAREPVPYTFVAALDGTTLTYEPHRPPQAPLTMNAGEEVSFITDEVFVVRSQDSKHPFHVNVYMTSGINGTGLGTVTLGDPDYVNVPPTGQYLDRYVFVTDYSYPNTSLTVVRKKTSNGFLPVELDCGGEIAGWMPLGDNYEYAWVELTRGFSTQPPATSACGYGRQEARSNGPFAITVWGYGAWASYGYVGGTGLRPINDAPPPTVN